MQDLHASNFSESDSFTSCRRTTCDYFFSPASGPVGTIVTITGSNFSQVAPHNVVYFGKVRAIVSTATSSSLTVSVPFGATFTPITVIVNSLTAYTAQPFEVTFTGSTQKLYCGSAHSLAIKSDSTLWAWGNNNQGQVGIGGTGSVLSHVQVSGIKGTVNAAEALSILWH